MNCYANSVLQCLVAIPELSSLYLSGMAEQGPGPLKRPVTVALSALMRSMWAASDAVSPYGWAPHPPGLSSSDMRFSWQKCGRAGLSS